MKAFFNILFLFCFVNGAGAVEYTLEDLYRFALERSERIKISEEDVVISEKTKDKALSFLFPRISTTGSYTTYHDRKISDSNSLIQPYETSSWSLRLDQTLSTSGRELVALGIAKDGVKKSRQDLISVKETYILNVTYAYYDLLRAGKLLEISKQNIERLEKYKKAAALRLKLGEITKTTLLRAEAELSGARSDLVRAQNLVRAAKVILQRIVGLEEEFEVFDMYESGMIDLRNAGEPNDVEGIEECISDQAQVGCLKDVAYRERSDIKALEIQKRMADAQVRYTKGAEWPTLSIEGAYVGRRDIPETSSLIRDNLYGGLKLSFPLFEGGLRRAEIQEALARKRQVEYTLQDLKRSVAVDVENAYLDYMTQRGILRSLVDQFAFADDNYKAVSKQFEFGLAQSIDVVDANTALVSAQTQLTQALYNYRQSIVRLKRVTGVLLRFVDDKNKTGQKAG